MTAWKSCRITPEGLCQQASIGRHVLTHEQMWIKTILHVRIPLYQASSFLQMVVYWACLTLPEWRISSKKMNYCRRRSLILAIAERKAGEQIGTRWKCGATSDFIRVISMLLRSKVAGDNIQQILFIGAWC
jgi:hypothetical protein